MSHGKDRYRKTRLNSKLEYQVFMSCIQNIALYNWELALQTER